MPMPNNNAVIPISVRRNHGIHETSWVSKAGGPAARKSVRLVMFEPKLHVKEKMK